MHRLSRIVAVVLALSACVWAPAVLAQPYPSKTIRMILPFPPGGPTDIIGRLVAQKLSDVVGQPVVADNRPGASGNVGLELASKAPPDGYTIVLSSPVISLSPLLYSKLNYDPNKDLAPISLVGEVRNVLVVHPSVPAKSLKELIALARKNPGKLNYGSGGIGTTTHLAPELLKSLEKLDIVHVPYKGAAPQMVAIVGGEVALTFATAPSGVPYVKNGRLRALGVSSTKRLVALPDVPTIAEAGVPGYDAMGWNGMVGPAAMPKPILDRIHDAVTRVVNSPQVRDQFIGLGAEPQTSTPDEFAALIKSELVKWAQVVKDSGAKLD